MSRRLQGLWPWRWLRALRCLAQGVRLHPSAALIGVASAFALARGTRIGARTRLELGAIGRCTTGHGVWISSDVEIQTDTEVRIGIGTTIQRRCTVNGSTRIGQGCIFAPNVFVSSGTHPFRAFPTLPIREQERRLAAEAGPTGAGLDRPIWIQDDCWLGVNAVVCPGVTVGKGSVVGANAVVTKSVPPYSVVAGSPARIIGRRLEWTPPAVIDADIPDHAIYLLGGARTVTLIGADAAIETIDGEAFRAALAAPTEGRLVRMYYQASTALTIEAAGERVALEAGDGVVDLTSVDAGSPDIVYCDFQVLGSDTGAVFRIKRLATVVRDLNLA